LCRHLRLQFYDRLLAALRAPAMHYGDWRWKLVVVNYASNQSVLCRNFFSQPSGPAMAAGGFAE
jgi:hypothetical protein